MGIRTALLCAAIAISGFFLPFAFVDVADAQEKQYWGAFVLSYTSPVYKQEPARIHGNWRIAGRIKRVKDDELMYGISWNYPSAESALKAATRACVKRAKREDCGPNGPYKKKVGYVSKVVFSSASRRVSSEIVTLTSPASGAYFVPGLLGRHVGKGLFVRQRCALIWSELGHSDEPNTPAVVFSDTEENAGAIFEQRYSTSANISRDWRNQLSIRCNAN